MDRPPSQMENVRPSGLKPPSKLPALAGTRTLQETSSSDLNARSAGQGSMLPPPTVNGSIKHKINGLPEPPTKRKTLAERAGEPANALRTHLKQPSSGSTTGFGTRPATSFSTYRNPSNVSIASSASSLRPSSRHATVSRPGGPVRQPSAVPSAQPNQDDEESDGEGGKRKGTPILSFNSPVTGIVVRKTRAQGTLRQQSSQQQLRARSQHSGSSSSASGGDGAIFDHPPRDSSLSSTSSAPAPAPASAPEQRSTSGGTVGASKPSRNVSLNTAFAGLAISSKPRDSSGKHTPSLERIREEKSPSKIPKFSCTPKLPHPAQSTQALRTPSPLKHKPSLTGLRTPATSAKRGDVDMPRYLTKDKLSPVAAWDTKGRLDDIEKMYKMLESQMASAAGDKKAIDESLSIYKTRVEELTRDNREISSQNRSLTSDLERARNDLHTISTDLRQARRDHERDLAELKRQHERELENLQAKHEKERQRLEREREKESDSFDRKLLEAKKAWEKAKDDETADLTSQHWEEMDQLRGEHERAMAKVQKELELLQKAGQSRATETAAEVQLMRDSISGLQKQLDSTNSTAESLRNRITTYESRISSLEQEKNSLVSKAHFLEGNQEAQSQEFTVMRDKMEEAIAAKEATLETLRREEMLRRKLNAMILELRGNIRVFVRTRPLLNGEDNQAKVEYIDQDSLEGCKEMVVHAPTTQTATGKQKNEKHQYGFDRVFTPGTDNSAVFEECRDLIQSVVDGYNVSILSYGQTGSGKTYGMSGPAGIIPSSIRLLMNEMQRLKDKGWEYAVEASFVEVYNETLNDLLGDAKTWDEVDDLGASTRGKKKEKHEIHHDATTGKTTVTNLTSIRLWPPPKDEGGWPPAAPLDGRDSNAASAAASYTENAVNSLLDTAAKNRRVAATKANERSSRSHSIFILKLKGSCVATNESSEGILNLVDLAGSERLKQSGAEGSRMKETQAINKSLSSLGDVIAALGNKNGNNDAHVPYRNSKLTYLLQSSLGGTTAGKSSRTLMLLHLSPLQTHWQESRSSLLFGSKVHGTHIGTAKKR
ncbi:Kinesin klpA [Lecanosticta acicola]|uniref:Kinesin klpA n=1 Tax=Lecanosticta acicola TaxID=111012 RepID=A0AAI9EAC3_9PEZI|nr:Kinesin klpA [Lecanosticta acicola]